MFDAYEVAVRLRLDDKFSNVMGGVINMIVRANGHATQLQKTVSSIGKMFSAGLMTTGAGFGMAMALKASTNEAVRYEQQLNRLKALNLDNRQGAGATKSLQDKAMEISDKVKGTTATDALRLVTETQAITGNVQHTIDLAPALAKLRFGMETYMSAGGKGEGHGATSEKQFLDIVKVMEMRGLMRNFSEEKMNTLIDLFSKNYVASGGQVKPSDFLAMMKTGGVAAKSIGSDFMFALGHIIQESGGNRAGTGLMSAYQNLVAGRTTQQVAEQLQKFGLLKPDSIEYGKTGHIKKVKPEALKASEVFQASPLQYLNEYILPAMKAKGVDIEDQNKVIPMLNQMFSARTASNMMTSLYMERSQIAAYMGQAKDSWGADALYKSASQSTTGQQKDLMAQVNKLELEFGTAALPLLKASLEQAIPLVKSLGEWMTKNQGSLSILVKGLAVLAASMLITGPMLMLGSGFRLLSLAATMAVGPLNLLAASAAMRAIGGAPALTLIASTLGTVGGQLKLLSGVGVAFAAGWTVGTILHDTLLAGTKFDDWLGRIIAKLLSPFSSEAAEATARDEKFRGVKPYIAAGEGSVKLTEKAYAEAMKPHSVFKMFNKETPAPATAGFFAPPQSGGAQTETPAVAPKAGAATPLASPAIAPKPEQATVQVTTKINLDGRNMAEVVSTHQAKEASKSYNSASGYDPTMSLQPVGMR